MDYVFWSGLTIGAILSLFASVAANLANNKIGVYVKKSQSSFKLRKRKKDLRNFERIKFLNEDYRLFTAYLVLNSTAFVISTLMAFGFFVLSVLVAVNERVKTPGTPLRDKDFSTQAPFWIGIFIFFLLLYLSIIIFQTVSRSVSCVIFFEKYKNKLVDTYPDHSFE